MSTAPYDTATGGSFSAGPSNAALPPHPPLCPPTYEEAIGRQGPLETPPTATTPPQQQQEHYATSQDFIKVIHGGDGNSMGLEMDQDIDEDDLDYEESRPLKMGRIPNTCAQYTFIQPTDTILAGKKKKVKNNHNSSTCGVHVGSSPLPSHPGYPHPGSSSACSHRYAAAPPPPHNLMQQQHSFSVPASGDNQMQRLYPVPGPALNAPSAPPSAPDTAPPALYAPPLMPPPPLEQGNIAFGHTKNTINSNATQGNAPVFVTGFGSGSGSSDFTSAAPTTTSYAPSPFPPPALPRLPAQEAPLAGVPSIPGLINSQDISIAEFERTKKGVESCDPVLGDPYQLYRFFVAHNDRPTLNIVIKGHHTEKRETYETDSDGNRKLVVTDHFVEDFKMDFDLTPYIIPRGALFTTPDPKTNLTPTIKQVLEQFADEENPFKEMHMHKSIQWDYEDLTRAITHAIRSRAIYKKVKDKTLKSEFQMSLTTRDFYMQYYWAIVDQVQYK
ncbi:hypothetical protein BGX24_000974 [Mortierella sp. AD032]|nr:hypothetical protein BGX24_000974 [Mortierella sp. AD032]